MKILKKLLFIGLISIFTIPKVFAVTNFTTHAITNLDVYINNHTNLNRDQAIEAWKNSILENIHKPEGYDDKEYYILVIDGNVLRYYTSDFKQNIAMKENNNPPYLSLRNNNSGTFYYCSKKANFNSLGEFVNFNSDWRDCSSTTLWNTMFTNTMNYYVIASNYDYFTFKAPTWSTGSFTIDNQTEYFYETSQIPLNFTNGSRYNFTVTDYFSSSEPIIYNPQIQHLNGYDEVTYYIDNYTIASNQDGYFIRIVNNTDGTYENISPDVNNVNQIIKRNYYDNVNLTIEIHDMQYNVLSSYSINTNINFNENSDYSIVINSVSNSQKIVYYDYIIKNNQNIKCYYSINDNNFLEDSNCTDSSNTYYLQLSDNGNITWEIRDLQNNVLYSYSQNFIFSVSSPFINFEENYKNDFLNLNILINRYETGDIVEYSINNSAFIETNYLEDYSQSQNIKYFTLNNVNNNDLITIRVIRNNQIITIAKYKANYLKYTNNSEDNWDINKIFNKISIDNINQELRNYITTFGNLIINSKIGNLLILQTICLVILVIIKMIKN